MTAVIKLPRMLVETVNTEATYEVNGTTVSEVFDDLFVKVPGLSQHLVDERGAIRPHVSVFVDGLQADLETRVGEWSEMRVLHAVSGG